MSVVLYGGEMAGVRHVSGVLFTMVMRWQVPGVLFSMVVRWQVSGVLFSMVVRWQVSGRCQGCGSLW